MSNKPIHLITHPRACSTAFERLFFHHPDVSCLHEPFDEAYYLGPERLHRRYEKEAGSGPTYKAVLDMIRDSQSKEGKRVILKTMARHLIPPSGKTASIAPSLLSCDDQAKTQNPNLSTDRSGKEQSAPKEVAEPNRPPIPQSGEPPNPSVVPAIKLQELHHTFLIRNPRLSIPSVYRLSTPEMSPITKWLEFSPDDTGYRELRLFFDFLKNIGQIGPKVRGDTTNIDKEKSPAEADGGVEICLVDADDLLDNPEKVTQLYCASVGLSYDPAMLRWDNSENRHKAAAQFERFPGFHDAAIKSSSLKPREDKAYQTQSIDELHQGWIREFGQEGGDVIRKNVDANMGHYEYLKKFAMKV